MIVREKENASFAWERKLAKKDSKGRTVISIYSNIAEPIWISVQCLVNAVIVSAHEKRENQIRDIHANPFE